MDIKEIIKKETIEADKLFGSSEVVVMVHSEEAYNALKKEFTFYTTGGSSEHFIYCERYYYIVKVFQPWHKENILTVYPKTTSEISGFLKARTEQVSKTFIKEFLDSYVEGTSIKEIKYSNENDKKWTITYNYDVEPDEFDSFEAMIEFMETDQFGEEEEDATV